MFVDQPPPPAAHVAVRHEPLTAASRREYLRAFRADFPALAGWSDVRVLDTAQRIVDTTAGDPQWATLLAQTQVLFDVDGPLASQMLALTLGQLAPGWVEMNTARLTPPRGR